ncbi:MAG: hypothetical protein ACRDXD_15735 [Acidimicrobiia bacterium]
MAVVPLGWNRRSALMGAILFAAAGATMGSMNAGWFGLERNANALFPLLGVGSGLVVIGFARSDLKLELQRAGGLGRAAGYLLVVAPVLMIVSGLVEFAIVGTLALAFGLISLAVIVVRRRLLHPVDRLLIALSAIGSLTWNTETVSAFLLVGVGFLWAILSVRVLTTSACA